MGPGAPKTEIDSVFVGRLLIGPLMSALLGAHDKALIPLGITSREGMVLLNCARREANTSVELAFYAGLDVSSMSRMLDRLEKKGLVTRTRSRVDRRKVFIELTPKGLAIVKKGMAVGTEVAKIAWRNVSEREKKLLRTIVYKVLRNLGHLQKS
jgi:DNA-binding MarR family transcriptional regulator